MDRNISHSTAYFVLDDKYQPVLHPPPGLYTPHAQSYVKPLTPSSYQPSSYQSIYQPNQKMTQIVEKYTPYEPNKNIEKKNKLEHDLVVAKQIVSLLEKELIKLDELIEVEKTVNMLRVNQTYVQENIMPVIHNQEKILEVNISKPTDKFIEAVHALFLKESPIMLSNIPHKLPRDVLPPKGYHGLFTKWMDQVPGSQNKVIPCTDISRKQFMYWIDHTKTKETTCFQKQRGKPCKLNSNGVCKYCK